MQNPPTPTQNKDLLWLPGLCPLDLCALFKEETLNQGLGNSGLVLGRRVVPLGLSFTFLGAVFSYGPESPFINFQGAAETMYGPH